MSLHARALLVMLITPVVIAALIAIAGSGGAEVARLPGTDLPLYAACVLGIFAIQWLLFIHAHLRQSEKLFDLTGSLTYIAAFATAAWLGANDDPRSLLLAGLVIVWALRLGSFLFARVKRAGHDSRFKYILPDWRVHLMTWTLQGFWVSIAGACALMAITSTDSMPLGSFALAGSLLWLIGFAMEVVADRQKTQFRKQPENKGRFITTGLWAWSRHPNYFGEILLWLGITLVAYPVLEGWQLLSLVSPLFVVLLMTKISGVDMLERQNDRRWRDDPDYQQYKASTSKLIPWPPAKTS